MAKKKKGKFNSKNVIINEEDLAITKIGELETAEQSPLLIFGLFGALLLFIFFLPTVVNLIKGPDEKPDYSIIQEEKEKEKEEENKDKEDKYYTFSSDLVVTVEPNIVAREFLLNGNTFSFRLINSSDHSFSFDKDNYFVELYTEENTLLERILLKGVQIQKNREESFGFSISDTSAKNVKKIKLISKTIDDYPNIILEKNNNQEEVLFCSKEYENLTYTFQNEKLLRIEHVLNYTNQVHDYPTLFSKWKIETERLNNISGIQSIFVNAGSGFAVNTKLDLKSTNVENANQIYYYRYDTLAKVVKFEMEARGFRCQ